MTSATCPACHSPDVKPITSVNNVSNVDYFRCDACRLVWWRDRNDPARVTVVVPGLVPHQ